MSDELAAETPDAAIRAYLFAIGFTLVLIGGEMMAEKPDPRFYTGLILVILGLPVHLSWVFWKKLKPWLGTSQLSEASAIATSVRWWLGILLVFLAYAVLSPFVERKWQFSQEPIVIIVSAALLIVIVSIIGATMWGKKPIRALSIHICRIEAHTDAVPNELYIDFIITAYNGEDIPLTINSSVSGTISIDNIPSTILSPPIIIDHHNLSQISAKSELTFAIRQHLPSATAATFHNAISGGNTMMFGFRSLVISVARNDRSEVVYRLPLWDGVSLMRGTVASKIVYLGQPQVAAFPIITGRLNVRSDG